MRVSKSNSSLADQWFYDGQMQVEEKETASCSTTTDYGLGARGIDFISTITGSGTAVGFPVYGAHGNTVATIGRSGINSYTLGNLRTYDAWGGIRFGATS